MSGVDKRLTKNISNLVINSVKLEKNKIKVRQIFSVHEMDMCSICDWCRYCLKC